MRAWGIPLRNGALLGAGLLSIAAVYLFATGQMTVLLGVLIVGGVLLCVAIGVSATRLSAVMELLEESQQSEAEIQRKLIDALAETDQTRLDTLAETVGVTPGYIMSALNNLIDLGLFAGAVAWDSGTVYPRKPGYSTALRACLHCGEPITIPARTSEVVCPICRTRHGEILTPNQ